MTIGRSRSVRAGLGVVACALAAACGSSASPTGIVAEVTTDLRVPADLDEVKLVATSASDASLFEQSFPLTGASARTLPLRVGFEESGNATVPLRIEAIGLHGGTQVVSRSATLSFSRGRVVLLPLPLLGLCRGVVCAQAATTCQASGTCGPDTTDSSGLPPYQPGLDGGAGGAPGSDGGIDSPTGADRPAVDAPSIETPADAPQVVPSLNDGLIGYWSFDSDQSPFPDHSGNGNDLAQIGGSFYEMWIPNGAFGGGLAVSMGAGVKGNATASVNTITSAITIGAFALNIGPAPSGVRTMFSRILNSGYWKLGISDSGAVRFTIGTQVVQAPTAITTTSAWVHIAGTYDGQTATLYVAGAPVFSSTVGAISLDGGPAGGGAGGFETDIGATLSTSPPPTELWNSSLDELTLYNRALTATEVAALAAGVFPMRR